MQYLHNLKEKYRTVNSLYMYSFIKTYICRCLYLYQLQIYYINNNNNHNNSNNITIIISLKSIYQAQKYYNNNGFKRASDW